MKLENNLFDLIHELEFIHINGNKIHPSIEFLRNVVKQDVEIPFLDNPKEKHRILSVILADIKWTINTDCRVTYISPFVDSCLGYDANKIIKHLLIKYLTPASILSCLIELEELKEIMRTYKNTEPRKLIIDLLPNESNIEKIELNTSAVFDSKGNIVGISGLCKYLL